MLNFVKCIVQGVKMRLNLSRTIMLYVGIIIVLFSVILGVTTILISSKTLIEEHEESLLAYAEEGAKHVELDFNNNMALLTELAEVVSLQKSTGISVEGTLSASAERMGYSDIAVVDMSSGATFLHNEEDDALAEQPAVKTAMQGMVNTSSILIWEGAPVLMEAAPIFENHELTGVLVGIRPDTHLRELVGDMGIGERGYAFLLDREGNFQVHPDHQMVKDRRNIFSDLETGGEFGSLAQALTALGTGNSGIANYQLGGEPRLTAISPIPGTNYLLGIGNYESDVRQRLNTMVYMVIGIAIVVCGLGLIAVSILSRRLSRPIVHLKDTAERIALGDIDVDLPANAKTEIGELYQAFNLMVESIREQTQASRQIASGDLSVEIVPRSEKDMLSYSIKAMVNTLNDLVNETQTLSQAAIEGQLDVRGDSTKFSGGYREIVEGFNSTLDAMVTPLNVGLAFIQKMADGEQVEAIENIYHGEYAKLTDNLNEVRRSIYGLYDETQRFTHEAEEGNLSYQPDMDGIQGIYREIVEGFNKALGTISTPLLVSADYLKKIGQGEIPEKITADYKGDYNEIKTSINDCIDGLDGLVEGKRALQAMSINDYSIKVEGNYAGIYAEMASSINTVNEQIRKTIDLVNDIAQGRLDGLAELEDLGKMSEKDELMPALILMMKSLKGLVNETAMLASAAVEGNLQARGSSTKFEGEFAQVVEGVNQLLDAILAPIEEAATVLDRMARGELHVRVEGNYKGGHAAIADALNEVTATLVAYIDEISTVIYAIGDGHLEVELKQDYRGDFVVIKESMEKILDTLNEILGDIHEVADQVASGSSQVSDGSQALSQGATEQASSIQQLTASIAEVAGQTKQNALNAGKADHISEQAKDNALEGNERMQEMLISMAEISESSNNIHRIIKVIDDIAFQTNILSLNAAVEAARAGQHGKGFAVVAEEVRRLAVRSAEAAKETSELIEGSIVKVQSGTKIADETAVSLHEIMKEIEETAVLVTDIAEASNQQASSIVQINKGLEQVSQVVQTNSATAEEAAASSEELSSQAELLKQMVGRFNLRKKAAYRSSSSIQKVNGLSVAEKINKSLTVQSDFPTPQILLSDDEFDKY